MAMRTRSVDAGALAPPGVVPGRGAASASSAAGRADDVLQVAPHERLAAGEPDVADAEVAHAYADQPADLLRRHQLVARHQRQALGRHAVRAAQRAGGGDRDPQVACDAPVPVHEQRCRGAWAATWRGGAPGHASHRRDPERNSCHVPRVDQRRTHSVAPERRLGVRKIVALIPC
jgi:hypothetical protein